MIDLGLEGFHVLLELLLLLIIQMHAATESTRANDNAFGSSWNFKRIVLHVFTGAAEDGVQQLFFRREFALALWADLADKNVARTNLGTNANHALFVKIAQKTLGHVWNVAREFLATQLGLAQFNIEILNVNAGEGVVFHKTLADHNGVFKVVAVEGVERHKNIATNRKFTVGRAGAVGQNVTGLDLLIHLDQWLLILTRSLVQTNKLAKDIFIGVVNNDAFGVNLCHHAATARAHNHAAVHTN